MGQQGWLQHPTSTETKRFHRDTTHWTETPMVFIDSGRPLPGQPALLKSRSYVHRDEATALWQRLRRQGWKPVAPQWGESEEV
ncbi:DUF1651 domain-containing protein [Synechococcus sp. RSCCF101]|uniref:DUF1651 domain-containing protein n=1 Tax=Synechococcus sp. RSCCF101 TaxID=2511069 RepID=UPI00124932E5|nr:DUF1651 domain-containing protein [Synechococcus sp. RSCCF101]QEY32068.1 DUF1651 domain-containing protein [Synechococcus sp. RSCCF101]